MVDRSLSGNGGAVLQLAAEGVSPWLAGVTRALLDGGGLARLVEEFGVRGASGDPASVADEVRHGSAYRAQLTAMAEAGMPVDAAVTALLVTDARRACDDLLPVYRQTHGYDGYFSMDLDPRIFRGAGGIARSAREMMRVVGRPNVLVRIPAARLHLAAIRDCLARGVGVHVAAAFSPRRHVEVLDAYLTGLTEAHAAGLSLPGIASVCALPIVRLDREVDARLADADADAASELRGRAGLAVARVMYQQYDDWLGSPRWRAQRNAGAAPQRLVWNTAEPDETRPPVDYVQNLVAWGTVNEMSRRTLTAFAERGAPAGDGLTGRHEDARAVLAGLAAAGISLAEVTHRLDHDSGRITAAAWQKLRAAVAHHLACPDGR